MIKVQMIVAMVKYTAQLKLINLFVKFIELI
jgi:hypothetical protein